MTNTNLSVAKLEANKQNALKSTGPKTPMGKAITKTNALKHGLLSKYVVITAGNAAEDPLEYFRLQEELMTQFNPIGTLEVAFVDKIAACLWRQSRALRYEAGLIRLQSEKVEERFYERKEWNEAKGEHERINKTDEEIDRLIEEKRGLIRQWKKDGIDLSGMLKKGTPIEQIYNWEGNWETLYHVTENRMQEQGIEIAEESPGPKTIKEALNRFGWDDKRIWGEQIKLCGYMAKVYSWEIRQLRNRKVINSSKLQLVRMANCIPGGDEQDKLLRYEAAIERQFYKALNQLERLQRMRLGDKIPAPLAVEVDVNTAD